MAKKKKAAGRSNLVSKLKALGAKWKKGSPRRAGASVPDDEYAMRIESMVIGESKSEGHRMQVTTGLIVIDGDFKGRKVKRYSGLDTEDNIDFLMGDLETLQLEIPDEIDDLGPVLESAIGLEVAVTVRTNDSFTNYDFQELLQPGEEPDSEEPEEDAPEEAVEEEAAEEEAPEESWPTEEEIVDMPRRELVILAKELKITGTKKWSDKKLAQALIENIYAEETPEETPEEAEEPEESEEPEEEAPEEEENAWPTEEEIVKLKAADLFSLANEAGIKNAKTKYAKKTKTLAKLVIETIYGEEEE